MRRGKSEQEVRDFMEVVHGLAVTANFTDSDCPQTLVNTDGKEIITKHARSVAAELGVNYWQIADAMLAEEIPDDPKALLQQLVELCKP
jgi:hypothetical protein